MKGTMAEFKIVAKRNGDTIFTELYIHKNLLVATSKHSTKNKDVYSKLFDYCKRIIEKV